jgi:hypothetical protein
MSILCAPVFGVPKCRPSNRAASYFRLRAFAVEIPERTQLAIPADAPPLRRALTKTFAPARL